MRLREFYFKSWRMGLLVLTLAAIVWLLYFNKLASLVPGASSTELQTLTAASDWHHIFHNPVNAPFTIPLWLVTAVFHHHLYAARLLAALYGLVAIVLFYFVIRPMVSYRVAWLSTVLFATTAGLLHAARLGTADILQIDALLGCMGIVLWYRRLEAQFAAFGIYVAAVLYAALWYVPGMAWLELLGLVLLWRHVRHWWRTTPGLHIAGWLALFILLLVPLAYASVQQPHVLLAAAGLPDSFQGWSHIGGNLLSMAAGIVAYSDGNPVWWAGNAPLLDMVALALATIGAYFYLYRVHSRRGVILVCAVGFAWVLASLGGTVSPAILVAPLYVLVSRGIAQLLDLWLTVFPRNPFAKFGGIGLAAVMLGFSVFYQVSAYFFAWPHVPAVVQEFSHKE